MNVYCFKNFCPQIFRGSSNYNYFISVNLSRTISIWPGTTNKSADQFTKHELASEDDHKSFRLPTSQAITMMDIGIRNIYNESHDIFRKSVRKFFAEEVTPNIEQWEDNGQVSREVWLKAGEQGILGTDTPAEYGGVGGTYKDACVVIEEQGYANVSSVGFGLHSQIVMPYITHYGSKEQIEKFIPAMTSGHKIGAIAMSEPGTGSDLQGIRTHAVKDGDDWILNGSKTFITNGILNDLVIVVTVTDPLAKSIAHGISLFLVEEGMPGYKRGKKLKKMGMKGQDTAELFFDDVRLPNSAILGKLNQGFYYLMNDLPQERLNIGVRSCANAEWMFEETRKYVLQRKAFGKPLSALQTIQHKLAEMKTDICVGRAFSDQCIELHSVKKLDNGMASMVKMWMTELQNRIAAQCVQMHGGWGYMWEYPICRAYVDARVQTIYGGSNEIMKELIQRQIVSDKRL